MRHAAILAAMAVAMTASAQTLNVAEGSVTYSFPAATVGVSPFADGTLQIMSRPFTLSELSTIYVDNREVTDNLVTVSYRPDGPAEVSIAGNIATYVTATVDGANVAIVQSAEVSEATCGEITYRLSGSAPDGTFAMTGSYKSTVELAGLSLTSTTKAPIDIQCGKRIKLKVIESTVNTLADGAGGSQKGCIVCKGHLEIAGKGSLSVEGNASHAIYAKEYITLKNAQIEVVKAVKDGVNCNQYFAMESGSLTILASGDDGIQVSFKDETDREAEDTGSFSITGGTITATTTADAAKCIKAEGNVSVSGGTLNLTATGNGVYDSAKVKTKASACLASDADMTIDGGTLNLTATGGGGKGINCDGTLTVNAGEIGIKTSGGIVAYVNNQLYTNYTGNTDRLDSDMKSSPKGIKADGDVTINGGNIDILTTGNGAEGIESKSTLTVNDGTIFVKAYDDCINSSSHMYIKGGDVTVISTNNDGLDSNGNLCISGGKVMAFGAGSPECGLDANEESGYTVILTGGTILAVGGGNSVPSSSSGSTQPYVSGSGSLSAGATVRLANSTETLAEFTVPEGYSGSTSGGGRPGGWGGSGSSILISCPGLTGGSSYTMTAGSSTSSVTATTTGNGGGGGRPW